MMNHIHTRLLEEYEKNPSYWSGSVFEKVVDYSTDHKGKWGEELLFNHLKEYTEIPVQWDADSNTANDDGVYDLFWTLNNGNKKRVEVKTSGRTLSKGRPTGWQHENVYYKDNKWDNVVFLDFDSNDDMYITVVDYNEIVKDNTIDLSLFGKRGHIRKNEEGKSKVDFSMKSIQNGIDKGVTFKYNFRNADNEGLTNFLEEKLGK